MKTNLFKSCAVAICFIMSFCKESNNSRTKHTKASSCWYAQDYSLFNLNSLNEVMKNGFLLREKIIQKSGFTETGESINLPHRIVNTDSSAILILRENGEYEFANNHGDWVLEKYGINFINNTIGQCDSSLLSGPFNVYLLNNGKTLILRHKLYLKESDYFKCEFIFTSL